MRRASGHGTDEKRCINSPTQAGGRDVNRREITFRQRTMFQPDTVKPGSLFTQCDIAGGKREMRIFRSPVFSSVICASPGVVSSG